MCMRCDRDLRDFLKFKIVESEVQILNRNKILGCIFPKSSSVKNQSAMIQVCLTATARAGSGLPKSYFFKRCTSFLHLFADVIDFEARYIKIWCILLCKQKRINMLKRIPAFGRRFVRTDWKLRNSKLESIFLNRNFNRSE